MPIIPESALVAHARRRRRTGALTDPARITLAAAAAIALAALAASLLLGCDTAGDLPPPSRSSQDRVDPQRIPSPAPAGDLPLRIGPPPTRTDGADPCDGYGHDAGHVLHHEASGDRTIVADYCMGAIPNLATCIVSWPTDDSVAIACEYTCDEADLAVHTIATWSQPGTDVRIESINPCPAE